MPEYYIAVFDEQMTADGDVGWVLEGPHETAEKMLEALNKDALDGVNSAQEILLLKTVDLDEA